MNDDIKIDLDREAYPAVGRCIYCGSDGGANGLRDEHIVPFALGGNAVLPKASCSDCEAIISYVEGFVGRAVFGLMRSFHEIQRRKRTHRPQTVRMTFKTESGDHVREVLMEDAPPLLFLRQFEPPGILEGSSPRPVAVTATGWLWYSHEFATRAERLRQPGDKSWSVPLPC